MDVIDLVVVVIHGVSFAVIHGVLFVYNMHVIDLIVDDIHAFYLLIIWM